MGFLKRLALALTIIGGINWGLIGFFQFDLVASIFGGQDATLSRVVYGLVGLSSLYCLSILFQPLEEVHRQGSVRTGKLNYGTEIGDEIDPSRRRY